MYESYSDCEIKRCSTDSGYLVSRGNRHLQCEVQILKNDTDQRIEKMMDRRDKQEELREMWNENDCLTRTGCVKTGTRRSQ